MTIEEIRKLFENSSFTNHLGFRIVLFEEGNVVLELPVEPHTMNGNNVVHGGIYATMLDNILGMTFRSIVKYPLMTINLNINYLKSCKGGKLVATAKVIKQGYNLMVGQGEIRDGNGQLLAAGDGTFKIMRKMQTA